MFQDNRLNLFEALKLRLSVTNGITHLVATGDSYSIMSHAENDWCVYCEANRGAEQLDGRRLLSSCEPFEAIPNPSEWLEWAESQPTADIHDSGRCPCARCVQTRRQTDKHSGAWETAQLIVRDILASVAQGHTDEDACATYAEWIAQPIMVAAEEQSLATDMVTV